MNWYQTDKAEVGYKIHVGDWIVLATPHGKKAFRVTKTTVAKAICELKGRDALKFPRYYTLPFKPLEKKTKPNYKSTNTWHVRVNPSLKRLRLRYD